MSEFSAKHLHLFSALWFRVYFGFKRLGFRSTLEVSYRILRVTVGRLFGPLCYCGSYLENQQGACFGAEVVIGLQDLGFRV